MRKAFVLLFLLLMITSVGLSAQEEDEDETEEMPSDDYEGVSPSMYSSGEQNFSFTLGPVIPLFSTDTDFKVVSSKIKLGGALSLSYNYFFTKGFFAGGEAGGMFAGTIGENMLYIIPFGVKAGYQFTVWRLEFPVSLMVGGSVQKYLETNYFGLFLKPSVSVFFRFNPDWSFGVNAAWWLVPEWTKETAKNMTGHFLEVTLSARFHF